MAVNKVALADNEVLIDLTADTVTPATLAEGVTAHDKSGDVITGTMPSAEASFEAGKKAEWDAFWDVVQIKGTITYMPHHFAGRGWTDENFRPKYNIKAINSAAGLFRETKISNLKQCLENAGVTLDLSKATNVSTLFGYSGFIKILPKLDWSSATTSTQAFSGCSVLESIEELKVGASTAFSATFGSCPALKHMIVTGTIAKNGFDVSSSTLLDKESLASIVNALSPTTSGLSITLSQTAVNNAFTSAEWDALEATKSNWTINLV